MHTITEVRSVGHINTRFDRCPAVTSDDQFVVVASILAADERQVARRQRIAVDEVDDQRVIVIRPGNFDSSEIIKVSLEERGERTGTALDLDNQVSAAPFHADGVCSTVVTGHPGSRQIDLQRVERRGRRRHIFDIAVNDRLMRSRIDRA